MAGQLFLQTVNDIWIWNMYWHLSNRNGLVNDYKDGKFYVNICDWPINKAHVERTLTVHEVPLINDTLRYPENYNL